MRPYFLLIDISMVALITMLIIKPEATESASIEELNRSPFVFKRSLCNTFGACGTKRSLPHQNPIIRQLDQHDINEPDSRANKMEPSGVLMAEALNNLLEYLQMDDRYKQGKYVVVIPKQSDGDSLSISSATTTANGYPSSMDLQEIQLGRA